MSELLTLARAPLALRRQALADKVAWNPQRGVYILRFPRRTVVGTNAAGVAAVRERYQALFDRGPKPPVTWAPGRLQRALIRAARIFRR